MATYTAVADANGDFTVPFSSNYTSGEKITVSAEKDGAVKTIELYAPSNVTGGGVIQFSGTLNNFPRNIGVITLSEGVAGAIENNAFSATSAADYNIFKQATGLVINGAVKSIGVNGFANWNKATALTLPEGLETIGSSAFTGWSSLLSTTIPGTVTSLGSGAFTGASSLLELVIPPSITSLAGSVFANLASCKKVVIPSTMASMSASSVFANLTSCDEIICNVITPPPINTNCFTGLKSTCIFKVPAGSVDAYKAATNWSAFAARIQAI